jgi:transposase
LWQRLHQEMLDRLGADRRPDWSSALLDAAGVRAKKGGTLTGPNPVDRGKPGSKLHVITDADALPLATEVTGANINDGTRLQSMVEAIPAVRSRRGPRHNKPAELRADKAHDSADRRRWLRERRITPRIARQGIESKERLGRYRWKVERTIAWLSGYRRLTVRYERDGNLFAAFLALAAALTCWKKLAT